MVQHFVQDPRKLFSMYQIMWQNAQNNASTLKFTEFAIYFQIEGIIIQFQIKMVITWGANLKLPKICYMSGWRGQNLVTQLGKAWGRTFTPKRIISPQIGAFTCFLPIVLSHCFVHLFSVDKRISRDIIVDKEKNKILS